MRAKFTHILLSSLILITAAWAQSPYSTSDLDTLVGPIALYPDPLLTNVIKASTFPDQVIAASQTNDISDSWDDSVKALDSYPDVLSMMVSNTTWMKSLGWAASNQLADTMDAVQRFRYRAQQAGNLSTNSQVQIISEGTTIRIEPANPQIIYVPTYNPVYVDDNNFGNAFVYGAAIATSAYLWTNIYHWNDNRFYAQPYGWRPPSAYYRPYGWQGGGVYGGNAVRINGGNNVVRGPVTVNNVNVNRTNINTGNINTGNRSNVNTGNWNNVNAANRTNVNTGNRVQAQPRTSVSRSNYNAQPSQRSYNASSPGLGSYSSSGSTMRESNRGAYSRGSTSFSSGARMGGGGRGGRR